ncbi:serine hydrolase [Paenibacillus sp. FSL R7-0273]|uniref:serine hydrolase n=1 Tax=Paenibacillus sp. FSL R7-0273 TaxID=1536772 RepID=UPI000693B407|nr:serine hydrolase [Paenibacillus sp. FSL R7-0273]
MKKYTRCVFYKPLFICLTVVLLLLSAGLPAYAAEGAVAPAEDVTPSGIKLSSLENVINSYMTPARMETTAAVSVAFVKDGQTIFNKAYGLADVENQIAADTDTVFEWASITKLLVWTSIMQLVEQGELDLQTDIREYLPEGFFKKLKYDDPITLLNLMHHNGGWQEQFTDGLYLTKDEVSELSEELQVYEPRQVYRPGKVVAYSNYGATLAGYIVEVQSGQPFYEYVNEHIFDVLGMDATSIHPTHEDNPVVDAARGKIQGYTKEMKLIKNSRGYEGVYPTGGTIGTTADLAKFMAALMPPEGKVSPLFKSNATLQEMLTPSLNVEGTDIPRIAHGFWVIEHAVPTLEHGGNRYGFSGNFVMDPSSGFGMIVMVNQRHEYQYCTELVDQVFGTYSPESYNGELPDSSEVEGTYLPARRALEGFAKIYGYLDPVEITAVNSRMYTWNGKQSSNQFAPYAYTPQYQSGSEHFIRNDQGAVIKISAQYSDYLPLKGLAVYSVTISKIVFGFGAAITLYALINGLIRLSIRKIRRVSGPASGLDKYHYLISTAGLMFIINNLVLLNRNYAYANYAEVRVNLIINIIYVLLAAGYIVMLLLKLRRSNSRGMRKVMYVLSGLSAVLFSALIIGWDLYF